MFDVGASVGYHSLLLYDGGTDSQLHLFEPDPTLHRLLQ
jgi:FkbM family methyltransferase